MIILLLVMMAAGVVLAWYGFMIIEKSNSKKSEDMQVEKQKALDLGRQIDSLKVELEEARIDQDKRQNNLEFFKKQAEEAKKEVLTLNGKLNELKQQEEKLHLLEKDNQKKAKETENLKMQIEKYKQEFKALMKAMTELKKKTGIEQKQTQAQESGKESLEGPQVKQGQPESELAVEKQLQKETSSGKQSEKEQASGKQAEKLQKNNQSLEAEQPSQ